MAAERYPHVLMDTPDGYCEERGWVEACVSEDRARDLLTEFCLTEDGNDGARPVGPVKRVHLRLRNPAAHWEDQLWVPCRPQAKTAIEFYEFDATDTEPASSRNEVSDG